MDWLTFFAEVIKAGAWPVATVFVVFTLRRPLGEILRLLKRLKYGNFEAEFDKEVKEAKESAEAELPQLFVTVLQESADFGIYSNLIRINPRSAVLEAWRMVEGELRNLVRKKGLLTEPTPPPSRVLRALDRANVLNVAQVALIHDLRALRNQTAHLEDFSPSEDTAMNYVQMALSIRDALRKKESES